MVRTKADSKAVGGKAPRKNADRPAPAIVVHDGDASGKGRERAGGNLYCPRQTPGWQKPITSFFIQPNESGESFERQNKMKPQRSPDPTAMCSTSAGSAGTSSASADN